MFRTLVASLLLAAGAARAGLTEMRATIPGSMHQCDNSSVFFFDTDDIGSKTLLFVSSADASKLGAGTVTLTSALAAVEPLQKIDGIDSSDAAAFSFFLKVQQDIAFSTFGFLSNGQGKNLKLDRTVMAPLPGAPDCLSGAAPVAASAITTVPASSATPVSAAPATRALSSSPQYASRFVTSTRPVSSATPVSSFTSVPATPPAATSSAASSASLSLPPSAIVTNATESVPAAAATSPIVVKATYLLTSFITTSDDQSTDGTVSSSVIKGGHVTGSVNGTILPIGNVLYAPNTTAIASISGLSSTNATAAPPMLVSATYTFTMDDGESVFVMAQSPLSQNFTTESLLMTLQSSQANSTAFSNMTIIGKPETINSTMFRIDAYYLKKP